MSLWAVDFQVGTNEDWCDSIDLTTPGESPVAYPLSDEWQIKQHLRSSVDALLVILDLSLANERLLLLQEEDTSEALVSTVIAWNVPKSVMETLEPGEYTHDIVFIDPNGGILRFAQGTVTIVRGVTRWQ